MIYTPFLFCLVASFSLCSSTCTRLSREAINCYEILGTRTISTEYIGKFITYVSMMSQGSFQG